MVLKGLAIFRSDASLKRLWHAQYYKRSLAEAREEGVLGTIQEEIKEEKKASIGNIIKELDLPDDTIARIENVPLELVQEVRTNLKKRKKIVIYRSSIVIHIR